MKYKKQFEKIISSMDEDFNWTTNIDTKLFYSLINNEISNNHELHNKKIIPIALCTNKYDILGYYEENNIDIFVTIHFMGYKSNIEESPYFEKYNSFGSAIERILNIYTNLYYNSRYIIMLESEEAKKQKSYLMLNGLYSILPKMYDCLFKMNEYRGELAKIDDENLLRIQDLFQFFSYDFVYKIRSIFVLCEIGNYADAAIILRSLTETFFYYKYYIIKNNGKKLGEYINQDKKNTTKIKDIMEYIAPDFYESVYNELCMFTHGNPFITGLFRGNCGKKDILKHSMYNINIDWFGSIINMTLPLILGYIAMFKKVYTKNTILKSKRLTRNISEIEQYIKNDLEERYNLYENQRKTINLYKMIINF